MHYDFDKPVDRRGSGDLKHEVLQERYGRSDLLPLWVADMDWETPSFITDALKARLEHSLFGYTVEPKEYWQTVQRWIEDHHQWHVERDDITLGFYFLERDEAGRTFLFSSWRVAQEDAEASTTSHLLNQFAYVTYAYYT